MVHSLIQRIRKFIQNPKSNQFESLALELFHYQFTTNPGYRHFCFKKNKTPKTVTFWQEIPALPQAAFKQSRLWLNTFPKKEAKSYFETSGTTLSQKGRHYFKSLALYQLATTEGFHFAFKKTTPLKKQEKILFCFLKESPKETPHSSLSHMFDIWAKKLGQKPSHFFIEHHTLQRDLLFQRISSLSSPCFLAGTALAFAALLKTRSRCPLPRGSLVMETGGFKGKIQEIKKKEFYQDLSRFFSLPQTSIYNEYGMTELFSQAYACGPQGYHCFPPWMRFRIIDPTTEKESAKNRPGLIELIDLANVESCLAIQTQDLGIRRNKTLELIGRISAEARGCSLSAEEMQL